MSGEDLDLRFLRWDPTSKKKEIRENVINQARQNSSNRSHRIDRDKDYKLGSTESRICLIFNQKRFSTRYGTGDALSERDGTDKDKVDLGNAFQELGFKVLEYTDPHLKHIENAIKKIQNRDPVKEPLSCLFIIILTHGDSGDNLHAYDVKYNLYKIIISGLVASECPCLAGKPKVVCVQACRGEEKDEGYITRGRSYERGTSSEALDGKEKFQTFSIPKRADLAVFRSSYHNFPSVRDRNQGSWFIQSLCDNLIKVARTNGHFMDVVHAVNREVSHMEGQGSKLAGMKQSPTLESYTMSKNLSFSLESRGSLSVMMTEAKVLEGEMSTLETEKRTGHAALESVSQSSTNQVSPKLTNDLNNERNGLHDLRSSRSQIADPVLESTRMGQEEPHQEETEEEVPMAKTTSRHHLVEGFEKQQDNLLNGRPFHPTARNVSAYRTNYGYTPASSRTLPAQQYGSRIVPEQQHINREDSTNKHFFAPHRPAPSNANAGIQTTPFRPASPTRHLTGSRASRESPGHQSYKPTSNAARTLPSGYSAGISINESGLPPPATNQMHSNQEDEVVRDLSQGMQAAEEKIRLLRQQSQEQQHRQTSTGNLAMPRATSLTLPRHWTPQSGNNPSSPSTRLDARSPPEGAITPPPKIPPRAPRNNFRRQTLRKHLEMFERQQEEKSTQNVTSGLGVRRWQGPLYNGSQRRERNPRDVLQELKSTPMFKNDPGSRHSVNF